MNKQDIQNLIIAATKERKENKKNTYKAVLAAIQEVEGRGENVDTEEKIYSLIKKELGKYEEAKKYWLFRDQKATDLNESVMLLAALLPKTISVEEMKSLAWELKQKHSNNIGAIMKEAKARYGASIDMKLFSEELKK